MEGAAAALPQRAFGPVEDLTESESSAKTAEEREVLGRRRRRIRFGRQKHGLTPRERLIDEKVCKNLLLQRCAGQCKKTASLIFLVQFCSLNSWLFGRSGRSSTN